MAKTLPRGLTCRLLKCSPFQHDMREEVDKQGDAVREQYWREVPIDWLRKDSPDLNEAIDRLLEARRPRAAFVSVHFALEEVELRACSASFEKLERAMLNRPEPTR